MSGLADTCPETLSSGLPGHLFLTLVNALLAAKCQFNTAANYPENYGPKLRDGQEFDFIVVGTGSAGSVVANKLSENGQWSVLSLEAGHQPSPTSEVPSLLFSLQGGDDDWQFLPEPQTTACLGMIDQQCAWPRGKCLGGTSVLNAMMYIRGNKQDYDHWQTLGNAGWDWDSVLPYFKANEDLRAPWNSTAYGKGGFQTITHYKSALPIRDILEQGIDELGLKVYNEEPTSGYFDAPVVTEDGLRANAAKMFLGKVKDRQNLHVATDAIVRNVIIEDGTAKGVVVTIGDRLLTIRARKEVILSAGAISSPTILLHSGIGPRDHLEALGIAVVKDLAVGENLQDHLFFHGMVASLDQEASGTEQFIIDELYRYFMHRQGDLGQISLTNFVGFVNTERDSPYPNLQIFHIAYPRQDAYLITELLKVIRLKDDIAQRKFRHWQQSHVVDILPALLRPKSRGRVQLRSKNPQDKPLIYANYLEDPDDVETILKGVRYVERLLNSASLQKYHAKLVDLELDGCKEFQFQSDDYWRCYIRHLASTIYHPVGTCKMGPASDPKAVVDSRLRVRGIKNLRVIDGSIMPTIVSANTHAPIMMIGQKGATMVIEDWSGEKHEEL